MLMDKFLGQVQISSGKENLQDVEAEDFEPLLDKYLAKRTDDEMEAQEEAIGAYIEAAMKGEEAQLDDEVACYAFADNIRNISIWAYKSSEFIGEEVLAYLPIQGSMLLAVTLMHSLKERHGLYKHCLNG